MSGPSRAELRWLAVAGGAPAACAFGFGSALAITTALPWPSAFAHAVVGAACGLVAAAPGLLAGARPLARRAYFAGALALAALLVTAGVGSWIARRGWGQPLRSGVLADFLPHAPDLLGILGPRAFVLVPLVAAMMVAPAWAWSRALSGAHDALDRRARRRTLAALGAASATFLALAAFGAASSPRLDDDPLVGLFRAGDAPSLPPTPERLAAWAEDEVERRRVRERKDGRRHVLVVLVDGVRPDHLAFYGYHRATTPFLSSLAAGPNWVQVPLAYSAATESLGGIGSIVAGRSPRTMSARSYGIVEFFARHGWSTHLLLNGLHDWYELRAMYGSRLTTFRDVRHRNPGIPLHDDAQVVAWAEELPPAGDDPAFLMFFLMGTHQLSPLAAADQHFTKGRGPVVPGLFPPQGEAERRLLVDRYDDQLRAADRHIAALWEILGRKGYLADSVVVFASDHGQLLGEHGALGHGAHAWEEGVRVPLALWSDRPLPAVDVARIAWTPDLAPTLAEAAGYEPPATWEGASLFRTIERRSLWVENVQVTEPRRALLLEHEGRRWKLVQRLDASGGVVSEQLFELSSDPHEQSDVLAGADPGLLARLRGLAERTRPDDRLSADTAD